MKKRPKPIGTAKVNEEMNGATVWYGDVEIFELIGHAKARQVYAWSYQDDGGETQYIAVLVVTPVITPQDAVRAAITSGKQD